MYICPIYYLDKIYKYIVNIYINMQKIKSITTQTASVVMKVVRGDKDPTSWYFMPLANETNKVTVIEKMLTKLTNLDSLRSVHIEFPQKSK